MQNHKESLLKFSERMEKDKILSIEAVSFYRDLFDFQYSSWSAWTDLQSLPYISGIDGLPLNPASINPDESVCRLLIKNLSDIGVVIKKHHPGLNLEGGIKSISRDCGSLQDAINQLAGKEHALINAAAGNASIGFEEYVFLLLNWLKPFFAAMREKSVYSGADEKPLAVRNCPFCGYYPDMGIFSGEKEGRRFIRCGLCENLWGYKRLSCAICGSEDIENLEYFTDEKNERYRAEACHICGGYIKTVRLGKSEDPANCDLTIENLLSAYFDADLLERGFRRA